MGNYDQFEALANQAAGLNARNQVPRQEGLQSVVRILKRRKAWIVGVIVLTILIAALITLLLQPTYAATAIIELNKQGSGVDLGLGDALSSQLSSTSDALNTDLQTESTILKGDSLALAIIQQLDLISQAPFIPNGREAASLASEKGLPLDQAPRTRAMLLRIFRSHLTVQAIHGTRLIEVTFESHQPKQAAAIANALIEGYKSQYLQTHYEATTETSMWLAKQLDELKENVEKSEKKLTDFERETGILSLNMAIPGSSVGESGSSAGIHSVVIQKLDSLNVELTQAEANRIQKEAIYRLVKTEDANVILGVASNSTNAEGHPSILNDISGLSNLVGLRQQRNQLMTNLAQAKITYGENNRHLKDIQTQISAVDIQIHDELHNLANRAEADLQLATLTEKETKSQFDKQQSEAAKLNEKTVEFAVLSQEAYSRKKLYEDLYTKLQEANVSAGIKATNITVVDPARTQAVPIRPRPQYNLAIGLGLGIFLGLVAAFTVDSFDRTVISPLELEQLTGLHVIGIIPEFESGGGSYSYAYGGRRNNPEPTHEGDTEGSVDKQIWILRHPTSVAAEAFRALRTSILLSRVAGGPKCILITSCVPGEGKTTVSSNLAVAFAQNSKKVILIDADMRRPRIKRVMDVSNEVGLSSVLAGIRTFEEAVQRGIQVPTLDILAAGPRPPLPAEMIGSKNLHQLVARLRAEYDIIIIDSPPALLLTDAVSIAPNTDAVVWVSRAGIVTRPQLSRATQLIERTGIPAIGFILNGVSANDDQYGYDYGHDYKAYGSYYGADADHDN